MTPRCNHDEPSEAARVTRIWFPGAWPDLNSYIDAERGSTYRAAKIKRTYTDAAQAITQASGAGRARTPCEIYCLWHVPDWRKDPDNVSFGLKFILDGMVRAGVLPNDGAKQISTIIHAFVCDGLEGVEVTLEGGE